MQKANPACRTQSKKRKNTFPHCLLVPVDFASDLQFRPPNSCMRKTIPVDVVETVAKRNLRRTGSVFNHVRDVFRFCHDHLPLGDGCVLFGYCRIENSAIECPHALSCRRVKSDLHTDNLIPAAHETSRVLRPLLSLTQDPNLMSR